MHSLPRVTGEANTAGVALRRRGLSTLSRNCRVYPTSWCQIEAADLIWYQFGTMEGEKDSQPGTEMAPLWKFVENLTRKEGMAGERVAAAKLHY